MGVNNPHYQVLKNELATTGGAALIGESGGGTVEDVLTALEAAVALLAALNSPALTGVPTAPTAALDTDTTQIATTAFVIAQISALIGAAPGALNTLEELADALADDEDYAATITAALALKAPLASPVFTGNPLVPTQSANDNSQKIASTAYVDSAVTDGATAGLVHLASATASANSEVDIDGYFSSAYEKFILQISGIYASSAQALRFRIKYGGSWITSGTLYHYDTEQLDDGVLAGSDNSGDHWFTASSMLSGTINPPCNVTIEIFRPWDTTLNPSIMVTIGAKVASRNIVLVRGYYADTGSAMEGIRTYVSSGTITAGEFNLWGVVGA